MKKTQIFQLTVDIDYLKKLIIPNFIASNKKPKMVKNIEVGSKKQREFLRYFERIAKEYGCKVELYKHQENSYFYFDTDTIAIGLNGRKRKDCKELIALFFHELAHRIQKIAIEKVMTSKEDFNCTSSFEEEIKFERTAERLAYFLCKEYFPRAKWDHRKFAAYRSVSDVTWLLQYYEKQGKMKWKQKTMIYQIKK